MHTMLLVGTVTHFVVFPHMKPESGSVELYYTADTVETSNHSYLTHICQQFVKELVSGA